MKEKQQQPQSLSPQQIAEILLDLPYEKQLMSSGYISAMRDTEVVQKEKESAK